MHRRKRRATVVGAVIAVAGALIAIPATSYANDSHDDDGLQGIKHIVVIYQENHSFDNLFGGWERVNGLSQAATSGKQSQVATDGTTLPCLPQNDVNLASPTPLAAT
jgi:phospholipase C